MQRSAFVAIRCSAELLNCDGHDADPALAKVHQAHRAVVGVRARVAADEVPPLVARRDVLDLPLREQAEARVGARVNERGVLVALALELRDDQGQFFLRALVRHDGVAEARARVVGVVRVLDDFEQGLVTRRELRSQVAVHRVARRLQQYLVLKKMGKATSGAIAV